MLKAELYKMKKGRIFYICALIVILLAAWILYKDTILMTPPDDISNWIQSVNVITSMFLSITSGFVITFLMQREYEQKTLINVLSAPTSRSVFLFSKLLVWLLWYVLVLGISMVIYIIGGKFIFAGRFHTAEIELLLNSFAKSRILSFIAAAPLLLISVLQRQTFYPSIMFSLIFTGIEMFTLVLPVKLASMIPWSAATLFGMGVLGDYMINAIISVIVSGVVGIFGAWIVFQKQNQ